MMRGEFPATYEEFKGLAKQGKLALDLLFNSPGWTQQPDFLNKATLLTDAVAALYGLPDTAVPSQVLETARNLITGLESAQKKAVTVEMGYYVGTGTAGSSAPTSLTFANKPLAFVIADNYSGTDRTDFRVCAYLGRPEVIPDGQVIATVRGRTVSWYAPSENAASQLNWQGRTYKWVCLETEV